MPRQTRGPEIKTAELCDERGPFVTLIVNFRRMAEVAAWGGRNIALCKSTTAKALPRFTGIAARRMDFVSVDERNAQTLVMTEETQRSVVPKYLHFPAVSCGENDTENFISKLLQHE